jgi:hypothetical protein
MIAVAITPAAYYALKATLPTMDGAASPGVDGHIRIWLDCKVVGELGRLRRPGRAIAMSSCAWRERHHNGAWRVKAGRNYLGERIRMPEDRAAAIPNLKTIKRALTLGGQDEGSRDRVFVREAGWQHLDAGKMPIA